MKKIAMLSVAVAVAAVYLSASLYITVAIVKLITDM
ncbi:Uncharacterised protein [Escherichia coli]|nr:Uncharacterised protein [Escherichia coli]CTV93991.1 Uncharacterised protein [Escherichia coli]CTX34840.1 Uncharacterised protein [Escherichia coli]CTX70217.1 Uncharacterised protein [Escherichia coli]CTY56491.1 Uncharacterised protein [Escherichia coli]